MKNHLILLPLLTGGILLAESPVLAAERPSRPEKISFKALDFALPQVGAFRTILKNGIPAYVDAEPDGVPIVRLSVRFRGGAYQDPKGKEGLAELMGKLLRSGCTTRISADALDERLEFSAGTLAAQFGDTTGIATLAYLEKDFKEGLDLFMQVLTQPAFEQDRLDQLKEEVLQEIQGRNDEIANLSRIELPGILNGKDHFTAKFPTSTSLQAISRADLQAFHARLLHPANMVVSVSGNFNREAMVALLNRTLGSLEAGPKALISPKVPMPDFHRKPGIYVVNKDVPQSLIQFALPGLRRTDPDWHAAMVMNQVLGGSDFTSRLMKKIRSDEGLTYGVGTGFSDGEFWKGEWMGYFQTKNRSAAYALRLTLSEIDRIKNSPVPADELAVIKDGIIQAFPTQWSPRSKVMEIFAQEECLGLPPGGQIGFREKIQAITAEDVQRVARKYLDTSQLVVLVVGRADEAEAGDMKSHPGLLKDVAPLPLIHLPARDPLTLERVP